MRARDVPAHLEPCLTVTRAGGQARLMPSEAPEAKKIPWVKLALVVVVVWTLVAVSTAFTVAPVITAPDGSVTRPKICPRVSCEWANIENNKIPANR